MPCAAQPSFASWYITEVVEGRSVGASQDEVGKEEATVHSEPDDSILFRNLNPTCNYLIEIPRSQIKHFSQESSIFDIKDGPYFLGHFLDFQTWKAPQNIWPALLKGFLKHFLHSFVHFSLRPRTYSQTKTDTSIALSECSQIGFFDQNPAML